MTILQNTPDISDGRTPKKVAAATSVSEVMSSINATLKSAGAFYADYSCKTVTSDELALTAGNEAPGGGPLTPITLHDFLGNMGKHGEYAGVDNSIDLTDVTADKQVSIRFMTTFLPVADNELASIEFAPEMYQYQTRSEADPANLLLLATTQGVAMQANGASATKLFHHAVEPNGKIARYWFEAERSNKKVGGAQVETKAEALEAAERGKATASVIGTRSMGTRFNVLMTIQVPLKQRQPPVERFGGCGALYKKSMPMGALSPPGACMAMAFGGPPPMEAMMRSCSARSLRPSPAVGQANAARVSRGSMVDRVDKTVHVRKPTRDASQHITVTVVIYNTVAGGVPSVEDVKAAVDDMEALYASCGWKGRLTSDGAAFMKKELTVKDTLDIQQKLATQPYMPPVGEVGLVVGGDVFPSSSGAA